MSAENRDAAVREAKLFLRGVLRNDWEFDPSANPDGTRPSSSSSSASTGALSRGREVTEWRCREFDSSGSELEPQSSDQSDDESSPGAMKNGSDPVVDQRRRRRRQMEEEMAWNEGLRMWIAQRNAWSGARTRRQIRAKEQKRKLGGAPSSSGDQSTADAAPPAEDGTAGASPPSDTQVSGNAGDESVLASKVDTTLSITEREKIEEQQQQQQHKQDQEEEQSTAPDEEAKRKGSTETNITEPDQQVSGPDLSSFSAIDDGDSEEEDDEEDLEELLIPVAPPLISPSNLVRATINPSIYPSIYSKVVVQGLTPTIPINLADLTKAMVQGWKADGQWPPKPAVTSIVLADDASVPKSATGDGANDGPSSRRKNSITNAMRKVFHNPFHRRGSSSHDVGVGNGSATGNSGPAI
ncbi:hypothetical protein N7532_008430 [Penicillium argentinense]|uniref:Gag1-like clamp domain-containing protein n=1 Tax=Penicillium argentinense TaxID=1131581 RepID=A0A9W9K205_9EURO|nr:uncharacterized protein N7532_008430 [Penicillium argentinense]KAJ5089746.1 hypothetical protein N7532_008430 [Penicillium argentinense]